MPKLDNDKFLTRMAKAFEESKTSGTVYLTMKRDTYVPKKAKEAAMDIDSADKEYGTTVRMALKKKKYSTVVLANDLEKFMGQYTTIVKINMDSLKKKERKKTAKAKQAKKATA